MRETLLGFSVRVAVAIALGFLGWSPAASALEIVVSGVADPAPERLAEALEGDDDLLRYSTPATPDAALSGAVADLTTLALQRQGYVDPAVTAVVETVADAAAGHRRVAVDVVPGQRLTAGSITINGLPEPLAAGLQRVLTSPQPPSSATPRVVDAGNAATVAWVDDQGRPARMKKPLWTSGEPAALDAPFTDAVQRLVVRFLRDEGFLLAADQIKKKGQTACRIAVVADKDADAGQATLSLDFAELPPPATLRDIAVKGTDRVTAATMRSFLKLEEGARVSEADRRVWEEQLRLSGRFIRHKVALESGAARDGGVTAVFDLLAYPEVTPLGEPLTREEAVMLRFRSWLSEALESNGIQVSWTKPDGTPMASLLLSAERGAVVMLGAGDGGGAVAVTEAGLGVFLSQHAGRFEVPLASLGQAAVQAALSVRETVDPETGDYRHDLGLAASFGSAASESEPAAVVTARIEPVACLALVHRKPSKDGDAENVHWRGDTLEIRGGDGGVARFDGPTGRLLEVDIASLGRITVAEAGSWDEQLTGLRDVSGPNAFRPQAPVSSAIGFFGSEPAGRLVGQTLALIGMADTTAEAAGPFGDLAAAVAAAAAEGGFAEIDALLASVLADENHRDELPVVPSANGDQKPGDAIMAVLAKLSAKAWGWLDETCGSEAWPTGLARLANAVLRQDGTASFQEVALFMGSDQPGPVAHLLAASAMPMKPLAASFAMRGQSRAEAAAFARECEPLLTVLEKSGLHQPLVATLRRLDAEQAHGLGEAWLGDGEGFASFAAALRACPSDQTAENAVPEALMAWWNASLGQTVSLALQERGSGRMAGRENPQLQR
ncbi:MAG: hypothetical protein ISQ70_11850 [Pirellulales bacterium]|nr:hypothetical protein [Pirellulales bacterium]